MSVGALEIVVAVCQMVGVVAASAAAFLVYRTVCVMRENTSLQVKLQQRQNFLTLWSHLSGLHEIGPEAPNAEHVVEAINAMELVAVCLGDDIVDDAVLRATFGERFLELFETICGLARPLPHRPESGKQLLEGSRTLRRAYDTLRKKRMEETQGRSRAAECSSG